MIDRQLSLPSDLHLFDGSIPTLVFTERVKENTHNVTYLPIDFSGNPLPMLLEELYRRKLQTLLVEGGSQLLQSFIDSGLWDEAYVEKCPARLHAGVRAPQMKPGVLYSVEKHFGRDIWHYEATEGIK